LIIVDATIESGILFSSVTERLCKKQVVQ
jgi:hypothetical protein